MKGSDGSDFNSTFIKSEYINSEIMKFKPEELSKSMNVSREYGLSSVNLTSCEKTIRKFYNISDNITLLYKKTDYSRLINQQLSNNNSDSKSTSGVILIIY